MRPICSIHLIFSADNPTFGPARYNKTKKGLELLRRQGTLALLEAGPDPDRCDDEDDEDGPLEGLEQLRDVIKVLRRLAGKAR